GVGAAASRGGPRAGRARLRGGVLHQESRLCRADSGQADQLRGVAGIREAARADLSRARVRADRGASRSGDLASGPGVPGSRLAGAGARLIFGRSTRTGRQTKAPMPVMARPTISVLISLVPS